MKNIEEVILCRFGRVPSPQEIQDIIKAIGEDKRAENDYFKPFKNVFTIRGHYVPISKEIYNPIFDAIIKNIETVSGLKWEDIIKKRTCTNIMYKYLFVERVMLQIPYEVGLTEAMTKRMGVQRTSIYNYYNNYKKPLQYKYILEQYKKLENEI